MDQQIKDYFRVAILFSVGILILFLFLMAIPYLCEGGVYSPDKYRIGQTESISRYSSNLTTAIASIGAEDRILVIDTAVALAADANVPDNITVEVKQGGLITLTGADLILHSFEAPLQQCFAVDANSSVSFGDGAIKEMYPQWFGATADGTTDDLDAIQDMINTLSASASPKCVFPNGTYRISDTIDIAQLAAVQNWIIEGMSLDSIIKPDADVLAFHIGNDSYHPAGIVIRDLKIDGSNGDVRFATLYGATDFILENVWCAGCGKDADHIIYAEQGAAFYGAFTIDSCRFTGCLGNSSSIVIYLAETLQQSCEIRRCKIQGNDPNDAVQGITTYSLGATLNIAGCTLEKLGRAVTINGTGASTITGTHFENNSDSSLTVQRNSLISGNRFVGSSNAPRAIHVSGFGYTQITGNSISGHTSEGIKLQNVTAVTIANNSISDSVPIAYAGTINDVDMDSDQFGTTLTDATLQAAITAIGSDHWTLNISRGTWVIDANLTFNANTRLKFEEGAVFQTDPNNPCTVTINGDIDAGLYQIFDVDANSTLNLSGSKIEYSPVQWFGAIADADYYDTGGGQFYSDVGESVAATELDDPLEDAIAAWAGSTQAKVYIPCGNYVLKSSISISSTTQGVTIFGEGRLDNYDPLTTRSEPFIQAISTIFWAGSADEKMFNVSGRNFKFKNLYLEGVNNAGYGIYISKSGATVSNKGSRLENVCIQHFKEVGLQLGDYTTNAYTQDIADFIIDNSNISYNKYNVLIDGRDVQNIRFNSCKFWGSPTSHRPEVNYHFKIIRSGVIGLNDPAFGYVQGDSNLTGYVLYIDDGSVFMKGGYSELLGSDPQGFMYMDEIDPNYTSGNGLEFKPITTVQNHIVRGVGSYTDSNYPTDPDAYHFIYMEDDTRLRLEGSTLARTHTSMKAGPCISINSGAELTSIGNIYAYDYDYDGNSTLPWVGQGGFTNFGKIATYGDMYTQDYVTYTEIPSSTAKNTTTIVQDLIFRSDLNDDSVKKAQILHSHYDIDEEDVRMLYGYGGNLFNSLYLGGGSSSYNTITDLYIYTGADKTVTGTKRIVINATGSIMIPNGTFCFGEDTASDDDYIVTFAPAVESLSNGQHFYFDAVTANTGACTINPNGLGAVSIKTTGYDDPPDNYIEANGMVHIIYSDTNYMVLLSPDANP